MGGWYASIQCRGEDRNTLLSLVETLAIEKSLQFLCGPVINGWIGIYPSKSVEDVVTPLAARWRGDVFYLAVHDDAVMQYVYFRDGKGRDGYWSTPGYFDESNRFVEEAQFGDPETYAHLINGDVARAKDILDRGADDGNGFDAELMRLAAFAELLGVSNVETSYEYLEGGDRDDIRGWEEFVHVPVRATPQKRSRRKKDTHAARDAEHARLIAEGVLLAVEEMKERPRTVTVAVRQTPVEIAFVEHHSPVVHPSGAHVVTRTRVNRGPDAIEIAAKDGSSSRKLMADVLSATEASARGALPSKPAMSLISTSPALVGVPPGEALAAMLAVVPPEKRAITEQHLRRILPRPPWNAEQVQFLVFHAAYTTSATEQVHDLCFSADGRWLACGTTGGLRVAEWSDVIAAPDGAPVPWRYSFDVPPYELHPNAGNGYVYAVVYDEAGDGFVFGGNDGRVRAMSLANGRLEDLLELHQRATVMRMKFLDRSTLAISAQPLFARTGRKPPPNLLVYVWNYSALRERSQAGGGPIDPPLEPYARFPIPSSDEIPSSPLERVIATLRAKQANLPSAVSLQPVSESDWPDADTRERLVDPLLKAGFRAGNRFVVTGLDGVFVQFFAQPEQRLVARLAKTPDMGTTLDLLSELNDGKAFVFTNRPFMGLDVPPGRTVHHAEGVDAKGLLYLMARHRPRMSWLPLDVDELQRRFEDAYPKERAWREKHGFSEAEAKRFLLRHSRVRTASG